MPARSFFRLPALSVAGKLVTLNMVVAGGALTFALGAGYWYDTVSARAQLVKNAELLADVIGVNSTAAISFTDARKML